MICIFFNQLLCWIKRVLNKNKENLVANDYHHDHGHIIAATIKYIN